jgi:hypothetical protein
MTRRQQAQTLLNAVEAAILEIVSGAASASISSGNGSKSYTRADLGTLRTMRSELRVELAGYDRAGKTRITYSGVNYV